MDGTRARALLGVSTHASPDELRRAFRRRALSTHPDRGGDTSSFDETVLAFRSLSATACVAVPTPPSASHIPFDAYDSAVSSATGATRRARPSFAEVLDRIAAAKPASAA